MTSDRIEHIHQHLTPLRTRLLEHRVYRQIDSLEKLQVFMQHHVFAVWDFMSLLKSLQQRLCGVQTPWLPPDNPLAARLVNEIVLGEESDDDAVGGFASHFDLYYRAMRRFGASTERIDQFLASLRQGRSVEEALIACDAPASVRAFVTHTFSLVDSGDLCAIASAFMFGREDLLPDVFQRIVDELNVESAGGLEDFIYYLNRHIELDGDQHGPLAAKMIASLCGEDPASWRTAEVAAVQSIEMRQILWDGMLDAMQTEGIAGVAPR